MRNAIVIVSILILGIFGWLFFSTPNNQTTKTQEITTEILPENKNSKDEETKTANIDPTKYIKYSKSTLSQYANQKRVLFFYANWCPTCKPINEELTNNSGSIPDGVVVIRVNYNDDETDKDEEALAKKYAITYQHTFVQIDENGEVVERWNGGGLNEIIENLQ